MTPNTRLSDRYAAPNFRATRRRKPSWTRIPGGAAKAMCTECAQFQHETRGACGARMRPRERRTVGESELLLCSGHAEAWRKRDWEDQQ